MDYTQLKSLETYHNKFINQKSFTNKIKDNLMLHMMMIDSILHKTKATD